MLLFLPLSYYLWKCHKTDCVIKYRVHCVATGRRVWAALRRNLERERLRRRQCRGLEVLRLWVWAQAASGWASCVKQVACCGAPKEDTFCLNYITYLKCFIFLEFMKVGINLQTTKNTFYYNAGNWKGIPLIKKLAASNGLK